MILSRHLSEKQLALYATHDLNVTASVRARLHLMRCVGCSERVSAYSGDTQVLRRMAAEIPAGVQWDRLAAEMTANIRVGLAAGECVAPRAVRKTIPLGWRVAAATCGFTVLLVAAWWINIPATQSVALGQTMRRIVQARPWQSGSVMDVEPMVEATATGIWLHENGGSLGMSQGVARPVSVSLSMQGAARARYIDSDTGQVTITSVYVH